MYIARSLAFDQSGTYLNVAGKFDCIYLHTKYLAFVFDQSGTYLNVAGKLTVHAYTCINIRDF